MAKRKTDIVIDLGDAPGLDHAGNDGGAESQNGPGRVPNRNQILADREKAGKEKALYIRIPNDTYMRLKRHLLEAQARGDGQKITLATIGEIALREYLDRQEKK